MNIVFLSSAGGYTFEYALLAQRMGVIGGVVTKIVTDRECRSEDVARKYSVPHERIMINDSTTRDEYTERLLSAIPDETDLVCISLMRLVGNDLISRFPGRLINTHPSLLPAYKGFGANKSLLRDGKTQFGGCSLHLVDAEADNGSIIIQSVLPLIPGLEQQELEIRLWHHQKKNFAQTLNWFADERITMTEGKVIVIDAEYESLPTNPKIEIDFDSVDYRYEAEKIKVLR
jgi:phosphoribosylglycinamide formyltransferase-1